MWRKIWTDSDWTIIICTILLVGIGLTAIGSATHVNHEAIGFGSLVVKQLVFFLANIAVVIGMQFLDYHRHKGWGNMIYVIPIVMPTFTSTSKANIVPIPVANNIPKLSLQVYAT